MDWFGKSSKVQAKNDVESLGIRFEPIVFYPDRNEYELLIELSGCAKDLIKVSYDKTTGKLKLQGQKQKTEFVQQFSIPPDCLATGIYGRFRGDVLHIIMPRLLSEWKASEEDDQKLSSDGKATTEAREDRDKLPDTVPAPSMPDKTSSDEVGARGGKKRDELELPASVSAPPPSDLKSIDEVNERGRRDRDELPAKVPPPAPFDRISTAEVKERGGKDREELPASVPPPPLSDQKSTDEVKERGGKYREELPARDPPPPPSDQKSTDEVKERGGKYREELLAKVSPPSPSDLKTKEKSKQRDDELFPEISAPSSSGRESSRSVKELREKFQKNLSKGAAPSPPPPPPLRLPSRAMAPTPLNNQTTEIEARKKEEEDRVPPSDQKNPEHGDVESEKSVVNSPKKPRKTGQEVAENAKIVNESNAKEESEKKKPSAGENETSGLVAKVKETGKAAVAAAMKEENRLVVMIGAAVLTILIIGASLRSSGRKTKN